MKTAIWTLLIGALPWLLLAQYGDYQISVTTYTEADGLSNNDVFCVNKDGRGLLWIGTRYGLNRFDGHSFRVFTTEHGLKSNFVSAIFPLTERHLLLGFGSPLVKPENIASYQLFDTYANVAVSLKNLYPDLPFAEADVREIRYMTSGFLFVLGNGKKYFLQDGKTWTALSATDPQEQLIAVVPDQYTWSTKQAQGQLVLVRRDHSGKVLRQFPLAGASPPIKWLYNDEQGRSYFALYSLADESSCLMRTDPQGRQETLSVLGRPGKNYLPPEIITHAPAARGIWAVHNTRAVLFDEEGGIRWELPPADHGYINQGRLNYFEANAIWQCGANGLHRIQYQPKRFKWLFEDQEARSFRGMARVGARLFFNAHDRVYEKEGDRTGIFLRAYSLASLAESDSLLWLAGPKRLLRINVPDGRVQEYPIVQNEIWSIWEDADKNLWYSENGVYFFDTATGTSKPLSCEGSDNLFRGSVYHFHPVSKDTVWLLSSTGLYVLDTRRQKITARYWSGGQGKYFLPTDDLRHLYHDKKTGEIWLATGQEGLLYWKPETGATQLTQLPGKATNIMHSVYADAHGFLWMSTDDGIAQWQRSTGRYRIFRTQDGLKTSEFNRIAHFQDTDGTLYFGNVNGAVAFHPDDFHAAFDKGLLQRPVVAEVQQYDGDENAVLEKTADYLDNKRLVIRPGDRFFTLTLALPDYNHAKDALYFYQLKGDEAWQRTESNQLTFWRLPYGRQVIRVKAQQPDGNFSDILEVAVWVQSPFYLRWWFLLLMVAGLGAAVYLRINSLRSRNLRLEQEVARRTEKIEQQADKLRQLDQMKSRFFANISHELRTPLTLIASPLQRLARQETDTEKKQFLYFAAKNSQRLLRLVNEILDLTKLEAAKLTVEKEKVQVAYFVRRVLAEFDSFAAHKGVHLALHTDLTKDTTAVFDLKKVETILYNFMANALKFTPAGGRVALRLEQNETGLLFEVADTGRGIAPEDLSYIFDRFYQSKISKPAEGGTGIGLALCKELATLMEGSIGVRSEEGKGATFVFWLPCELGKAEAIAPADIDDLPLSLPTSMAAQEEAALVRAYGYAPASLSLPASMAAQEEGLPHLLLVEDNEDLQRYIAVILQADYHLTIANNGKIAADFLHNCDVQDLPALIVSDIMMPEMDGFQLLQHLKSTPKYQHIPVVMLTARAGQEDKLAALRIGVDDYLTKPFAEEELRARIQNLIQRAELRTQLQAIALETNDSAETDPGTMSAEANDLPGAEWLAPLERYILEHLTDATFSVASTAEAFGMSRFKFTRAVSLAVGMTALDYIQEIRLHEARRILETTPAPPVKEVAAAVGFANPKLFSRKFQQRFGVYPSQV